MMDIDARPSRRLRCAIYTRKSSEEGLDMEFNSLDAQRESCEAYVASQRLEGFAAIRERYDDGGHSGGTLERPALQRLLVDVEAGLIDVIVVYKIDRLSRSLMDFAKLVEIFDRNQVTFVSVTQSFNTTTSMGRLTLNILLSFAQFEREVIGERIRDKIAASRKRGMWMGGFVPLGYRVENRKLLIEEAEAATVRMIFERFVTIGSATVLAKTLAAANVRTRRGKPIDKGFLYKLINNRVYIGEAVHKGTSYPGEHEAIINRALWDKVHAILQTSPRQRASNTRAQTPALLKGLIFTATGTAMTPTVTKKGSKLYRYYTSMDLIRSRMTDAAAGPQRLPAGMVEDAVIGEIRRMIATPEIRARALAALKADMPEVDGKAVISALGAFDALWASLFLAGQARIIQLLVARVTVGATGLAIDLRHDGIGSLARQMMAPQTKKDAA